MFLNWIRWVFVALLLLVAVGCRSTGDVNVSWNTSIVPAEVAVPPGG